VRSPGDTTGLTRMGVHVRAVEPGFAGTKRHFHTLEEVWAYVLEGSGAVRIGPLRIPVSPGHFIGFPAGPRPHHFVNDGSETLVLLEGGERRAAEDDGWYPDVRKMWHAGTVVESYEEPPSEEGDACQVLHVEDVDIKPFRHDVDRDVYREVRSLHPATGLTRQAVHWARVASGGATTAFHAHEHTDEWVFILSGRATARAGEDCFEVSPGDFLGHPAGGAPHVMEAVTELTYLMGGMIDADDVVTYPDAGLRRIGSHLEPLSA